MKQNPFRMAERVGNVAFGAVAASGLGVVGYSIADHYSWGWWGLLLIPGIPLALIVLVMVAGLVRVASDSVHDWWLMAKWRWDDAHRDSEKGAA